MSMTKRTWPTFSLLLRDQRSAVRLKIAALASLIVLATAATGFLLMTLGEAAYQNRAKRVLFALHDDSGTRPAVSAVVTSRSRGHSGSVLIVLKNPAARS
jgi:hypothetical protein